MTQGYDVEDLKAQHKLLKEFKYDLKPVHRGYNHRTLYINLSTNEIKIKPVSQEMIDKFIGGKGFCLKLMWDAVNENTKWDSEENVVNIGVGPVGGNTAYAGSGKSIVTSISPLTNIPIDSNVGGFFGPYLKFSGFDALEIQGKAAEEVIVYIDGNKGIVQIYEAPGEAIDSHVLAEQMIDMYAETPKERMQISSVSAGTAADNSLIGCLNFSFWDVKKKAARLKQAGRGGIGTVFRDKKIKGLVAKYSGLTGNSNDSADPKKLVETGKKIRKEMDELDQSQCRMREIGTAHLSEIMDEYDLLPTHNFKYGSHEEAPKINSAEFVKLIDPYWQTDGCWIGCAMACAKATKRFPLKSGPYKGEEVVIDGPEYETLAGCGSNLGIWDPEAILEINFYCDTYGLDTISFGTMTAFIMECWQNGILDKDKTGGLDFTWGRIDDTFELLHQISRGEGFGLIAGKGIRKMKDHFEKEFGADRAFMDDIGMEAKGLEYSEYITKESLAMQGGYGLALKGPQHDEAWLIFMDMVNNQIPTFKDKAEALHYFPMFRTWFSLQGLCKLPWNDVEPADNAEQDEPAKVPEHVQNYVDIYNAITGKNMDKQELIVQSERVYNFQKVFNIRMGYGRRIDDSIPYRSVGPVTVEEYESRADRYDGQLKEKVGVDPEGKTSEEKVAILREHREGEYEKLIDAAYERRGWTSNGTPKIDHMANLGMDFPEVVEVIKKRLAEEN